MNKKILFIAIIFLLIVAAGAGAYFLRQSDNEADIRVLVDNFGAKLKNVSLLSPTAPQDIEQNYKEFISSDLLEQWKSDPSIALGRQTSSPWPDSIEIAGVRKIDVGSFDVYGKIIDMTSSGIADSRAIQLVVAKIDNRWFITQISVAEKESLKEHNKDGISFQYPEKLEAEYISTQEWPPAPKIESSDFTCVEASGVFETTWQEVINGRIYCVNLKNEGAAGSTYSSYVYTTQKGGNQVSLSFVLRYPNCDNYPEERSRVCFSERDSFNLGAVVDEIVQSIKIN